MMMQKKVFTLALVAGLAAPLAAFADSANVTFYGVLDADVEHVSNSIPNIATAPATATLPTSRNRVTSNASRFGLKGSDDLGGGLQAIYQVESRVNLVGNETGGGGGAFSGIRNTNLCLKGDFGTAFVGNWDTPFKTAHNPVELFDNSSIATATALMGTTTATTVANGGAVNAAVAYTLRQNSSLQYWTPVMSGFQGKFAYSTNNTTVGTTAGNTTATATTTAQIPSLVSLSVAYDVEQFYAAFAYDKHTDFRTVAVGATVPTALTTAVSDSATRLVGAYKFGEGQVGLAYDRLTVATQAAALAATTNSTRGAWELSGKYKFGASNVGAFYTKAGNVGSFVSTGAKQVSLRYGYNFSKRTEAYGMYTAITNDVNASYGIADVANGYTVAAGSKVSGLGVGLRHTF
jgi:predicted porin